MAQVPPTPLLPLRMGHISTGEWDDESLLMDQQPMFGDDSILDITFNIEHSQGGIGDGDMDTPKKGESSRNVLGDMKLMEEPQEDVWAEEVNSYNGRNIALGPGSPKPSGPNDEIDDEDEVEMGRAIPWRSYEDEDFADMQPTDPEPLDDFEQDIAPVEYHDSPHPISPSRYIETDPSPPLESPRIPQEFLLEETSFLGWGERPTLAESERSLSPSVSFRNDRLPSHTSITTGPSSISLKRAATSPRQSCEKKRIKPRSPGRDDYYSRRLSRPSSSLAGSFNSPSLPSIHLSASTSSVARSFSAGREVSGGGPSRTSSLGTSKRRDGAERESHSFVSTEVQDDRPPAPRPTMLSRFLAKSTVLHPTATAAPSQPVLPLPNEYSTSTSPAPFLSPTHSTSSSRRSSSHRTFSTHVLPNAAGIDAQSSRISSSSARPPPPDICDTSISSTASTSITHDLGSSLRRSTSQRVIGFFSDLLRTSSSSRKEDAVSCHEEGDQSPSVGKPHDQEEVDEGDSGDQEDVAISHESHLSRPSSSASCRHAELYHPPSLLSLRARNQNLDPDPPGYRPLTRPSRTFISHTASRAANPIRHPVPPVSSFASAALAKLPPPGKGASAAGEKITIKPTERATNLQARRALFERPQNQAQPLAKQVPIPIPIPMKKTIPLSGKTPGKAARARAEERRLFDKAVQGRLEEKRRIREAEEKRKKEDEEREYLARRKETVVRARPVPEMYRRKV